MATRAELLSLVETIGTGQPNTALEMRTVLTALVNGSILSGDVQLVDCTNAYITANFDGTGLGINERVGWAICNGNNSTRNWNGRVPMAYGTSYATMGAVGGSKDAVVVEHTHTFIGSNRDDGHPGDFIITSALESNGVNSSLSTTGVSGTDKNLQPYTVVLAIMKL